ncbi:MAG: hypothetical protein MST10_06045 [Lentisphaeria bacterium]|nr:hypothetical protein [Lentisphaeria bacterium]
MEVKFISHRGESHDAPENTLAAFKLAFERCSDGVECDVHLTADNLVVVAHDWSTHRMGDQVVVLEESDYAQISRVDVSGSHLEYTPARIPLLYELLEIMPEKSLLYLELKGNNPKLVDFVAEILRKYPKLQKNITIISFNLDLLRCSKAQMPEYKTLYLTGFYMNESGVHPTALELMESLKSVNADGVDACCDESVIDEKYVKTLHDNNYWFAVWTVDHLGQGRRFIDMGVDTITSNRAALLKTNTVTVEKIK